MKNLTIKEMTPTEQRYVKTQLDKARIHHGRVLTNSEKNKVKQQAVNKIIEERISFSKRHELKEKPKKKVISTPTFNWSASIHSRPRR